MLFSDVAINAVKSFMDLLRTCLQGLSKGFKKEHYTFACNRFGAGVM